MIWRIRERSTFTRLAREGQRSRAGVLWCTYVLDPVAMPPQVAYAIGRAYGPAVQRNRTRRQLRSLLDARSLPAGHYLFGVRPQAVSLSYTGLAEDLDRLINRIESHLARVGGSSPA